MDTDVTLRRVALCLGALPAGEWPEQDHAGSWTVTDYLLASLIDEVRQLTWLTAKANGAKQLERPAPMYRPGTSKAKPQPKKQSWGDFARQLASIAKRNG
jgi:hypothetical protein